MPNDRDLEIERLRYETEKLRIEADAAKQQRRLTFYGTVFTAIMSGVITPILLSRYHTDTVSTVKESKEDLKDDIKSEATVLKEQASTAAENSAKAVVTASKAADETSKLNEKADTNLLLWKAYHTKEPEDMNQAAAALAKVEGSTAAGAKTADSKVPDDKLK